MISEAFELVEKEQIPGLHFPAEEVELSSAQKKERDGAIERAITLGNLEHQKVMIYFEDDQARRKVNTTIWAVTDTAIVLKQHTVIPIRRIVKLEI